MRGSRSPNFALPSSVGCCLRQSVHLRCRLQLRPALAVGPLPRWCSHHGRTGSCPAALGG
eukprot:6256666-Alexandrium_andersonii.AAC.1